MNLHRTLTRATAIATISLCASSSRANIFGTATVTNADHYGYYGFASTSAHNTKATIGGFAGIARVIHVTGTFTNMNIPETYADSIQVQPSSAGMAVYQPAWQFSNVVHFGATLNVQADIYAPGGFDASKPINLEMFSLDDEEFVPGLDARSTLTYSFDDSFAPGTAQWSGQLIGRGGPTFARPTQFGIIDGDDQNGWDDPEDTGNVAHYAVQPFFVATAGEYAMVSANGYYSAGVLYENKFDPANPLTNCIAAREQGTNVVRSKAFADLPYLQDAEGGTNFTADLVPGVQYYYVTTAYDSTQFGIYSNIITGPGNVSLGIVPEPASVGMIALAGMTLRGRRRRGTLEKPLFVCGPRR